MKKLLQLLLLALCVLNITACAELRRDRRDAAWDSPVQTRFDQIPAWEGAATRVCCGHLRVCEAHQTPRC